jgi:hypothetical protein
MRALIIEPGTTERLGALIARGGIAQFGPTPRTRGTVSARDVSRQ